MRILRRALMNLKALFPSGCFRILALLGIGGGLTLNAALPLKELPEQLSQNYHFDLLTPTGEILFRNSVFWESRQIDEPKYPKPAQCAANVAKVFRLSGFNQYAGESVARLLESIVQDGGRFVKFPKTKKGLIAKINTIYGGNIPAGTVVGGCLYSDCFTGETGQRHSAIVSNTDGQGTIFLYHNNWYRPENEKGVWKPYMVSQYFLKKGFKRQWMQTPWLRLIRNSKGAVVDLVSLMPAIDDLDPFQYFLTLALPRAILEDLSPERTHEIQFQGRGPSRDSDTFDVEWDDDGTPL